VQYVTALSVDQAVAVMVQESEATGWAAEPGSPCSWASRTLQFARGPEHRMIIIGAEPDGTSIFVMEMSPPEGPLKP
jgi:hypothetical protein